MSVTYEAVGTVASSGSNGVTPGEAAFTGTGIPSGTGTGFLACIHWGNHNDAPVVYDGNVWTFLGTSKGGAGTWGTDDTGPRSISYFWTTQDITGTTQTFINGGSAADTGNMIHGYIVRCAKTLAHWVTPEIATATDNVAGAAYAATFDRDPGGAAGDLAVFSVMANTDAVNPAGLTINWPGLTLGTNTAIITSPFATGHDSRVAVRYRAVSSGTSSGAPDISSSTDFTGPAMLARLRDSDTAPITAIAGVTATRVSSTEVSVSWTHPADAPDGVSIARAPGAHVNDGNGNPPSHAAYDPLTISGAAVIDYGITAPPYNDTGLTPGTYTYWVVRTST